MRKISFYFLIIVSAALMVFERGYSQNNVVSFNQYDDWNNPFDLDQDTIWAYQGDCVDAPLYIYFMALGRMYGFRNIILIDTNYVLSDVSLKNTIFADRFTQPQIIHTDSFSYVIRVGSIFSPPYYPEPVVRVALRFRLLIDENSSPQAYLTLSNIILPDSSGSIINDDEAYMTIMVNQLSYERGDLDHDSLLTRNDLDLLVLYIFQNGSPPNPISIGDINKDCTIDIEDVLYLRSLIDSRILKGENQ